METHRTDIGRVKKVIESSRSSNCDPTITINELNDVVPLVRHHVQHVSRDKGTWKSMYAELLLTRATKLSATGNLKNALQDCVDGLAEVGADSTHSINIQLQLLYGRCLLDLGFPAETIEVLEKTLEAMLPDSDQRYFGTACANIATALFITGHFEECTTWFAKAADHYHNAGLPSMRALSIRGIGMAYSKMGKYDDAFSYYEKAKQSIQQELPETAAAIISITESIGVDYLNLADISSKQHYFKKALNCFDACLVLAERHEVKTARIVALKNKGLVNAESVYKGFDLEMARALLEEALQGAKEMNIRVLEAQINRDLSGVYERLGDLGMALTTLREWVRLDKEITSSKAIASVQQLLVRKATEDIRNECEAARQRIAVLIQQTESQHQAITASSFAESQKQAVIATMLDTAANLRGHVATSEGHDILNSVIHDLRMLQHTSQYWQALEMQLVQTQPSVSSALLRNHPSLTPKEQRICAFVMHGLTTKDMARLLNVDARSIEKYRQRIRKKLGLQRSDNLISYLTSLSESKNVP